MLTNNSFEFDATINDHPFISAEINDYKFRYRCVNKAYFFESLLYLANRRINHVFVYQFQLLPKDSDFGKESLEISSTLDSTNFPLSSWSTRFLARTVHKYQISAVKPFI